MSRRYESEYLFLFTSQFFHFSLIKCKIKDRMGHARFDQSRSYGIDPDVIATRITGRCLRKINQRCLNDALCV